MATHTETNASINVRGKNNTIIIQQGTEVQQGHVPAVVAPSAPTVQPSAQATALPSAPKPEAECIPPFFMPVDKEILARAEQILNCGQKISLDLNKEVVALSTAQTLPAYDANRWNGTNGKHINSLSEKEVIYLKTLLNKEAGSNLPINDDITPEFRALAAQKGILRPDGGIIENALEALDKKSNVAASHTTPSAKTEKPAQSNGQVLDKLSPIEISNLIRVINQEKGTIIDPEITNARNGIKPLVNDELRMLASEIGVRNPDNGVIDKAKLQALFKEHGLVASAPAPQAPSQAQPPQAPAPKADAPATTAPAPKADAPATTAPTFKAPPSYPAPNEKSTQFDGTNGRDIGSLSKEQVTALQTIIAGYKNTNERYDIPATGAVDSKTREAAYSLGIIDKSGRIYEGRLDQLEAGRKERTNPAQQSSAEVSPLQALFANLPELKLPTFDFSNTVSTVPTEGQAPSGRSSTSTVVGR